MLTRKMIFGIGLSVLLCVSIAGGTTYYVDPNGSDDANGLSWETAFATINRGVQAASDGDEVCVAMGTYYESLDMSDYTIMGRGKEITIRGSDPCNWDIVSATVVDSNGASQTFTLGCGSPSCSLRGLTVIGGTTGVYCIGTNAAVVSNCIITNNVSKGVDVMGCAATVTNCIIKDNGDNGICVGGASLAVKNSIISGNNIGIRVNSSCGADIRNCTIVNNDSYGVKRTSPYCSANIKNCILWDNGDELYDCSATYSCIKDPNDAAGAGNICGDANNPKFAGDERYCLLGDSPCIDIGAEGNYEGQTDIEGLSRVTDMPGRGDDIIDIDMGAAEFTPNKIWYVDDDASGNGTSWSNAFKYLQDALKNSDLQSGDEIWVAQGVYKPDRRNSAPGGTGDREATFQLKNGVTIRGGYKGGDDTTGDERSIAYYKTILSGDLDGNDGDPPDFSNYGNNSYHVVTSDRNIYSVPGPEEYASDPNIAILDGFTITGGNANGPYSYIAGYGPCSHSTGGGMYNFNSGAIVTNCVFAFNQAKEFGGGLCNRHEDVVIGPYVEEPPSPCPKIENCVFYNNRTTDTSVQEGGCYTTGGGGAGTYYSSAEFINCVFNNNWANADVSTLEGGGGGIKLVQCYAPRFSLKLTNCTFYNNSSNLGGNMNILVGDPVITNCIFANGTGTQGGIYATLRGNEVWWQKKMTYMSYCNIQDVITQFYYNNVVPFPAEQNNIDADPLLFNPDCPAGPDEIFRTFDDGLRLMVNSPCIDAANDATAPIADILGNQRVEIPEIAGSSTADIGAYEFRNTWFVDDTVSNGDNDGTSWGDAFTYLQDAIDAASYSDDIRVAQGTYKPDCNSANPNGTDDREATFQLKNNVTIRGGYSGNLDNPDQRDITVYQTILSGDISVPGDASDNSYHVVTGSGTDAAAILDGFTVTDGNANGGDQDDFGGGMYNDSGSPTVTNCTFTFNTAFSGGGGMYNRSSSSPTVTNCTFSGNSADDEGGGMCNLDDSSPTVTNCTFSGNSADDEGGGMCNLDDSIPTVTNCTFSGNSADGEGGGMCNEYSSPTVTNCMFSGNSAGGDGGGMYNYNGSPTVTNCVFTENEAYGTGGGMCNWNNSSPSLTNCIFSDNLAQTAGGGMYNFHDSSPTLTNCIFTENGSLNGGGIWNSISCGPTLTNCTFYGNSAGWGGGGMYDDNGSQGNPAVTPTVTNCIFWDNSAGGSGDEIYSYGVYYPTITYCDIKGGYPGEGNIGENPEDDPLFVNPGDPAGPDGIWATPDDGLRLGPDSQCIDVANDAVAPDTDISGQNRIDVPGIGFSIVDIGAYECLTVIGLFVDDDAPDTPQNGESWETAFKYLQDALDEAEAGDRIWVAEGTYYPDDDKDGDHVNNEKTETFQLINGVAVGGGYAGLRYAELGAESPNDRDIANYKTTLSGARRQYHVVTGSGTNSSAILEGCAITRGDADGQEYPHEYGGGMLVQNGSPTVKDCIFSDNSASEDGAGVFISSQQSSPNFTSCVFYNNHAGDNGGGIYNAESSLEATNCVFTKNRAYGDGGGIAFADCVSSPLPKVINCTFYDNYASTHGDGIYNVASDPIITNCILWDNGEEIYNYEDTSNPTVTYCAIEGGYPDEPDVESLDITNIDSYPLFVDLDHPAGEDGEFLTSDDGLRLKKGSPCSDTAYDDVAPPTDILGRRRIDNKIGIGTALADMGAYEGEISYVYEQPSDLFAGGLGYVARYIGGADGKQWEKKYPDPNGEERFSVTSLLEFEGHLYAGGYGELRSGEYIGKVWRYDGEGVWNRVGNNLGMVEDFRSSWVQALAVFQGELHALVISFLPSKGVLYRYEGGTTWSEVAEFYPSDFGLIPGDYWSITSGHAWNDNLYVGTVDPACVGYYDGTTFNAPNCDGLSGPIADFQEYNNKIYACGWNHVYEFNDELGLLSNWELLHDPPAGSYYALYTRELEVFQDKLYVAHGQRLKVLEGGYWDTIWVGIKDEEPYDYPTSMTVTEDHPILGDALIFGMGGSPGEIGQPWNFGGPIYSYDGVNDAQQISNDMGIIFSLIYCK